MTEVKPSPVTVWRPRPSEAEAVRWDRSPAVLAVLEEWGAEPTMMGDALRVWGPRGGYKGALHGDWLVRQADAMIPGVSRYTPEEFAEKFEDPAGPGAGEPSGGELLARALLLERAQECLAFERERADAAEVLLARIRELAGDWTADDGQGPPTKEMLVEADCGRTVLNLLNGGHPLNGPHPAVWSEACAPGGMVCAVPDPGNPDGICGNPVETEPCNQHEEAEGDA